MLMYLGNKPTIIVSFASVLREIIKSHDIVFSNRVKSRVHDKLLYNSRSVGVSPYGEYWRQKKSVFVHQLLSSRRVRSFSHIREEETAFLMNKIRKKNSSLVNLSELCLDFTNDVICRAAFGRKYSENQLSGVDFKDVLKEFIELIGVLKIGEFIPWLGWVDKFGLNERLEKVAKRLDFLLEEMLTDHLDRLYGIEENGNCKNENEAKDFLDILLEVQKENSLGFPLERDDVKALMLEVFSAGTDTTFTVLEWAMTELLRNPTTMEELEKEVRQIARGKDLVTEDDLEQMKYLKAVIKEAFRLHPPLPLLFPRETTQDIHIRGYKIAGRTTVMINAWAIQRDPAIWEDAEEFRPERFLNSLIENKGLDFELIPFGVGRRICPGISFAMATYELVLANLVYKFDWVLPNGVKADTLDMTESTGITIHRKFPLLAIPTHIFP